MSTPLEAVPAVGLAADAVEAPASIPPADTLVLEPPPDGVEPPDLRIGVATEGFDRWLHAQLGRLTAGVSPAALVLAYADWLSHLALSPAKQSELVHKAWRKALRLAMFLPHAGQAGAPCCIEPLPQDRRFADPAWRTWPFNVWSQAFLLTQQWWHNATTGVRGVSRHHEEVVNFIGRQLLDVVAPSNFVATNPQVLRQTMATLGTNLARGAIHWWDDWERQQAGRPDAGTEAFRVGGNLAVT
ncbi:MAG TPA: poly-beta-hydroxybutyrate polymerase N-terminal domain-containing protein, partial [Albitalea sp.]